MKTDAKKGLQPEEWEAIRTSVAKAYMVRGFFDVEMPDERAMRQMVHILGLNYSDYFPPGAALVPERWLSTVRLAQGLPPEECFVSREEFCIEQHVAQLYYLLDRQGAWECAAAISRAISKVRSAKTRKWVEPLEKLIAEHPGWSARRYADKLFYNGIEISDRTVNNYLRQRNLETT